MQPASRALKLPPMRANDLVERAEPNSDAAKMLVPLPSRKKFRTEMELPISICETTDIRLLNFMLPKMLMPEPVRTKDRTERELPNSCCVNADRLLPNRA
jgi:hypothetical protein